MKATIFRRLALGLFAIYLALFPGSTLTVALDRVPAWGEGMGAVLLVVQGLAAACWLLGAHGGRGALAGLAAFLLAWAVEHIGETTGFPFGRYAYTDLLQPQLFGVVPLPIACAWLVVALGAWQLATGAVGRRGGGALSSSSELSVARRPAGPLAPPLVAATLVLALDLQIETVATLVTPYWVWREGGPYYGVPAANFIAWWLVGLAMAGLLSRLLPPGAGAIGQAQPGARSRAAEVFGALPALLYVLSSVMFTAINLSRGFAAAGAIGVALLVGLAASRASQRRPRAAAPAAHRTFD